MKQYLKARAVESAIGHSAGGHEQIGVVFEITEGPRLHQRLTWYGFFTETSAVRTIESLRHCGWKGDALDKLTGLSDNIVELVTDDEEFNGTIREKVQWVNRGGGVAMKDRMTAAQVAAFAAKMMGLVIQQKQASAGPGTAKASAPRPPVRPAAPPDDLGATGSDDGIPF